MYTPLRPAQSLELPLRHMKYHVLQWGTPQAGSVPLVLGHGWMDVAASWQFVVDALSEAFVAGRRIIAPDWRGFGRSMPPTPCDHYTFADYLGDLDALVQHLVPAGGQIDLVGHSMGGNIAMLYAGARPARIRHLVNVEGFGLPATRPTQAPRRIGQWLDELQQLHSGAISLKSYADASEVAQRLRKNNPRLPEDKALWLAQHWSAPQSDGRWAILGDAAHKVVNPQLFRVDEVLAHYAAITAPVLAIEAEEDSMGAWWKGKFSLDEYHERLQSVPQHKVVHIPDAGHMIHHDQPQLLARFIEDFCNQDVSSPSDP